MAFIQLGNDMPGIIGLLNYRKDTGEILLKLAETLLREANSLSRGEREMIATVVSNKNNCKFCMNSHRAIAKAALGNRASDMDKVLKNPNDDCLTPKMNALVQIALSVAESGKSVQPNQVTQARSSGASDREIHDTVLIAAAFCMYNRYVDGMQTFADLDDKEYSEMGQSINQKGYLFAA
jgi:uncharacterized peroxidase-related enzyme